MEPPRMTLPNARGMRILHAALTAGLTLGAIVFFIVRRVSPVPALAQAQVLSLALTVAAISAIVVAFTVLRPRFPARASEQTADVYWGDAAVRMSALVLWAVVEGAGLIAAVGYLLTGATPPLVALVLAILTLASLRPERLAQDQ